MQLQIFKKIKMRYKMSECVYNSQLYGILVFEKYGNTNLTTIYKQYRDVYEEHQQDIKNRIKAILDTLYDAGIKHGDLHSDNFLIDFAENEGVIRDIRIIDFDASSDYKVGSKRYYTVEVVGTDDYIRED